MRKVVVVICGIILLSTSVSAQSAFLEQGILDWMAEADPADETSFVLMMEDRVDIKALKDSFIENQVPVSERPRLVMRALKDKAEETQKDVLAYLAQTDQNYSNLEAYWINNTIVLKGTKDLILELADLSGIQSIEKDLPPPSIPKTVKGSGTPKIEGGIEPGLAVINAPELWAMGYTGHGRIAMTYDTGISPEHPSLSERFLANLMPLQTTWLGIDTELPFDRDGHGTHVTGTMLGLDAATADTIGVAPRAYFISTDALESGQNNVGETFQWILNPDGDENTSDDVPDVINNSWGYDPQGICSEGWAEGWAAMEAAGVANVKSAGNEGPAPGTVDVVSSINVGLVCSFTVASVNGGSPNLTIANSSSRGPSACDGEGSLLIKPEVSAPGVNVRSAYPNGEYEFLSGTSMAGPHASGAVLLLKEAYPMASGEDLLMALYLTAIDLGEEGEDNTYGNGLIDVKAAFDYLAETFTPVPPQELIADIQITEIVSPSSVFGCSGSGEHSVIPVVKVRNNGTDAIQDITFRYTINQGEEVVFVATALLPGGAEEEFELDPISYSGEGMKELHFKIDEIENEYDLFNNNRVHRWTEFGETTVDASTFSEDFSGGIDDNLWFTVNDDAQITWSARTVVQANGTTGTAAWMNHPDYNLIESQKDYLVSPGITNFSPDENLALTYDYFYRKRTSNDFQQDTFAVYLTEVCSDGLESIELLRKAGDELYTNPNAQSDALPESADDWVQETISLPELNSDATYYFSFVTRNRRGNNFLLDNIFFGEPLSVKTIDRADFALFPNPTNGSFTVKSSNEETISELRIFDLSGRQLERKLVNASIAQFDQEALANGVYIVQIELASGETGSKRLIIQ